jgi:putative membrane-bound dehydrogenase-like protein
MLYLKDTNGDDKADERKVLFTGWGTFDTHAGPSSLRWGFDNWIWGCVGYAGFEGEVGGEKHNFKQAFFRFKPDGSKPEVMTSTSNNTWGLGFNENGDVFGSTANNEHSVYMAIPNTYMKNYQLRGSSGIDKHKQMDVLTDKIRQVDVFGGFTAACGHNFYTARAYPKEYWNRIAFVNEPTGHVLHNAIIEQKGSDFEEKDGWNLIASAEEWFAPVFAEVGPDGAVWILDWYSFIIQHNPTPQGFKTGAGNAYESPVRDFTHGRIYRIGYKNAPAYQPVSLSKENPSQLIKALSSTNLFWRTTAQRLLVERGNKDVVPQLVALVNDKSVDEVGVNGGAIHALWTLHGLNQLDGSNSEALAAAKSALNHSSSGVRRAAIKVLPKNKETVDFLLSMNLLTDKDPLVALDAALTLSECPYSAKTQEALMTAIQNPQYLSDKWIPEAYTILAASNKSQFLKAYMAKAKAHFKQNAPVKKALVVKSESSNHDHHMGHQTKAAENSAVPEATVNAPDLTITGISFSPAKPKAGDQVTFTATIKNQGTVATIAGKQTGLQFQINGDRLWNDAFKDAIQPGESVTLSQTNGRSGKYWKAVQGAFQLKATVNEWRQNEDSNPSNNSIVDSVKVRPITSITPFVVTNVTRTYTMEAPYDSVLSLLASLKNVNNEEAEPVLSGIFQGWSSKQTLAKEKDKKIVKSLMATADENNELLLNQLLENWNAPIETDDKDVVKIFISSVPEMIKFTKKEFTVQAGKKVEIIFENPDQMQHNIVIGAIGSMEKIGLAADKMITQPDGKAKNYVPEIPEVLFFSKLVDPGQKVSLKFTAPSEAGNYPYVCTFPGHWRIMNGVMKVK